MTSLARSATTWRPEASARFQARRVVGGWSLFLLAALTGCAADVGGENVGIAQGAEARAQDPETVGRSLADWVPDVPLAHEVQMSKADKLLARVKALQAEADTAGIVDPPRVGLVRWIKPEEFATTHVRCLNDAGFDVAVTDDGTGINSETIPAAQTSALEMAMYTCSAQYSVDPRYSLPLSESQLGLMYDYMVESYIPCVEGLGHQLSDPPSKDVYIGSPPLERWQPILELRRLSETQFNEVAVSCPDAPSSDVLYGS